MRADLSPYLVIARSTYKEIIREKLLYGVLLVALLLTASSFFMATISFDQNARVLQNIGLASIHLFTVLIMIFTTVNAVNKDVERRALYVLLPKPLSRTQYVMGKYAGLLAVLGTVLAALGGLYMLALVGLDRGSIGPVALNLVFSFLEISLIVALAQLLASFAAPLNALLYTTGFYAIGHALPSLKEFADKNAGAFLGFITDACYYLLPNLEKFNVKAATLYGIAVPGSQIFWMFFYAALYSAALVFLTTVVMRNREV